MPPSVWCRSVSCGGRAGPKSSVSAWHLVRQSLNTVRSNNHPWKRDDGRDHLHRGHQGLGRWHAARSDSSRHSELESPTRGISRHYRAKWLRQEYVSHAVGWSRKAHIRQRRLQWNASDRACSRSLVDFSAALAVSLAVST